MASKSRAQKVTTRTAPPAKVIKGNGSSAGAGGEANRAGQKAHRIHGTTHEHLNGGK